MTAITRTLLKAPAASLLQCININGKKVEKLATRTFKRGSFIYSPNQRANNIYFINSGRVKIGVYANNDDPQKHVLKSVIQTGEMFGELALVGQTHRTDFALAMEKTVVYVIPLNVVNKLMQQNRYFNNLVMQILGENLMRTQRRLEALVFKDAQSRVIDFLCELAAEKGKKVGYETLIQNFYTHQEIGNFTSTSRQTVTTTLNKLRQANLIYFDRKRLLIRNLDKLKKNVL